MRTIKFRAWDKIVGRMVYDFETLPYFMSRVITNYNADVCMQFTGLLDKNGQEIYEGDIIEIRAWQVCREDGYKFMDFFYRASVNWGLSEWSVGDNDTLFNNEEEMFEGENILYLREAMWDGGNGDGVLNFSVIGNIWENPELLSK